MRKIKIPVQKLPHAGNLPLPKYMTAGAVGMDLLAAVEREVVIRSGDFQSVPTGLQIALPEGFEAQVRPRSGIAARFGVTVRNAPGTVDSDYRGEIKVLWVIHGAKELTEKRGNGMRNWVLAGGISEEGRTSAWYAEGSGSTGLNAPGTANSDYRGEIKVLLVNHGAKEFTVKRGDRPT